MFQKDSEIQVIIKCRFEFRITPPSLQLLPHERMSLIIKLAF